MYPSKHDAFLGAQKVGLHQALGIAVRAYEAQGEDWPMAVSAGISALLDYLASEPAHAHLTRRRHVRGQPAGDRNPRNRPARVRRVPAARLPLRAVRALRPGIAPEAIAGGIWQVLHNHIEHERVQDIADLAPQLIYVALAPFIGGKEAGRIARKRPVYDGSA